MCQETHIQAYTHKHIHTQTHTHTYTYIYTRTHTHTNKHTHTHTHTYMHTVTGAVTKTFMLSLLSLIINNLNLASCTDVSGMTLGATFL